MTAIQRWYFYRDYDEPLKAEDPIFAPEELWCKAADVAQLELLLKRYLEDLSVSRQSRDRYRADLAIADAKIASLEAEQIELHGKLDALLLHCPAGEYCETCARTICPHKDGMHFHHDGCPSCAEEWAG